jgi:hypothetical protein
MKFTFTLSCGVSWQVPPASCAATVGPPHSSLKQFLLWNADLINGTYACENSRIMNEVVREEFGFQGCECYNTLPSRGRLIIG